MQTGRRAPRAGYEAGSGLCLTGLQAGCRRFEPGTRIDRRGGCQRRGGLKKRQHRGAAGIDEQTTELTHRHSV